MSVQSNLGMTISLTSSYHLQMAVSLVPYLLDTDTYTHIHTHTYTHIHTEQEVLQHVLPGSSVASKLLTMHHAFSGNTFKNHVK